MDFSIIIRLINRNDLKDILASVSDEVKDYSMGEYELIVLDLFEEDEDISEAYGEVIILEEEDNDGAVSLKAAIMQDCIQICQKHNTRYFNKSVPFSQLQYDHILFIDSDVQFCTELKINRNTLLGKYAKQYEGLKDDKICGLLGITALVGNCSLKWKALEYSRLYRDYYSQHTYLNYANFSSPNNVSYLKSVIEKAGLADSNLPKTMYDHLDFSYSLNEKGYKIKLVSDIVVNKQREQFNKESRLKNLLKASALSDYNFGKKYPHTLVKPLPSLILLSFFVLITTGVLTGISFISSRGSFFPIILGIAFCIVSLLSAYLIDTKKSKNSNFFYYILGRFIDFRVYRFREKHRRRFKDRTRKKVVVYNAEHAKAKFRLQAKKLKIAVFNLIFLTLIILILLRSIVF